MKRRREREKEKEKVEGGKKRYKKEIRENLCISYRK
jgi:hypothetical protein